jgi:perosamine synthetase
MSRRINSEPIEWWSVKTSDANFKGLKSVLKNNFPNEGPVTLFLEEFFKDYFKVNHAVLTTSGTIAIYLGLKAIGIGPGDRVAVPNLTFIATANAVSLTGATPVLVDVLEKSLCIDPVKLEAEHLVSPLNAVVPVHVSGRSAFSVELNNLIKRLGLPCVEDAAEAFGSKDPITGNFLGTIGSVGAFSFSPNKLITSGQGGLVLTNDLAINNAIREIKDQGRLVRGTGGDDLHNSVGFNFKFTDLQAALLAGQTRLISKRIHHLKNVYEYYREHIKRHEILKEFNTTEGEFPLWPDVQLADRSKIEKKFQSANIGYRRVWHPLSTQAPYRVETSSLSVSLEVAPKCLWLASSFNLKRINLASIVAEINEVDNPR